MYRVILGAIVGAILGAGLAFAVYRFGIGAFDIAYMSSKGSIYSTDLMVHVAGLVGGASGGIIGAIAGAARAVVQALDRSTIAQSENLPFAAPAKQRF